MEERGLIFETKTHGKLLLKKQFLNTFWTLAENTESVRTEGALNLLSFLTQKQNESSISNNAVLCSEVNYALKRLIRGLASVRDSARQGFSMVLTELLSLTDVIDVNDVLKLIKNELVHPEEKKSKQYVKQYVVGQVFAYICLVQSGKLSKVDGSISVFVIEQLQSLAKWKTYLSDLSYPAIIEIIRSATSDAFTEHIWPHLETELKQGWETVSPYNFAVLLTCRNAFPNIVKRKFFLKHYGSKEVLDSSHFSKLKQLLYQSRHSLALATLFDQIIANVSDRGVLVELWHTLTEGGSDAKLFSFLLLERVLPSCSEEEVNLFFSDDLVRYLMSQLASKTSNSREHLLKFVEKLPSVLHEMKDAEAQVKLLQRLLISPGHLRFDNISKTQTHHNMVKQLSLGGVELYLEWLKVIFISGISPTHEVDTGPESDSDDNSMKKDLLSSDRRWAAANMMFLVKQPSVPKTEEVVTSIIKFFFAHAFFDTTDVDADVIEAPASLSRPLGEDLQQGLADMFRSLMRIIGNAMPYQGDQEEEMSSTMGRHCGCTPDGELRVYLLVEYAQSLLRNAAIECREPFDEETRLAWDEMMSAVSKIRKKLSSQKSLLAGQAFQLLFLHVGLQLFTGEEQSVDILKDLQGCYKNAISRRRSSKKSEEEPDWTEVVTEILLSILSKPDLHLRMVIELAFRMICPHLTEGALQLLLDVFDPRKSNLEIEDSDEEEEEEEEEQDHDEEGPKKNEKSSTKPKENGHNEGSSESSDDDNSEDEEDAAAVDAEFLKQVKDVLGDAAAPPSDEEESGSDSDMSDNAMMQKDAALSEVFKQRRRKGSKEIKAQMVNFKLRVLELLDIFVKKQSTNPLIVKLVVPILQIATQTANQTEEQLAKKATVLFRNHLCKAKKYSHEIADQQETIHHSIEEILSLARKVHSTEAVSLVSCGCAFLMRMLRGNEESPDLSPVKTRKQRKEGKGDTETPANEEKIMLGLLNISRVAKVYGDALNDFMTNRSTCLQANLFIDLVNRQEVIAWQLAEDFAKFINSAVLPYRQIQACVMLRNLYKFPYQGGSEDWEELHSRVESQLVQFLDGVLADPSAKRPTLIKEFLLTVQSHATFIHSRDEDADLTELSSRLKKLQEIVVAADSGLSAKSGDIGLALKRAVEGINNETFSKKQKQRKRKKGWKRKRKGSESSI